MLVSQLAGRALIVGLLLATTFGCGYWLRRAQKPYHPVLFNLHKFAALGAIGILVVTVYQVHRAVLLAPLVLAASLAAVVIFAATIVIGGLVSLDRPAPSALALAHKLLPYFTAAATAISLYLVIEQAQA